MCLHQNLLNVLTKQLGMPFVPTNGIQSQRPHSLMLQELVLQSCLPLSLQSAHAAVILFPFSHTQLGGTAVELLPTQQLLASELQACPMPFEALSFRIVDQDWQYGCWPMQWLFTCITRRHTVLISFVAAQIGAWGFGFQAPTGATTGLDTANDTPLQTMHLLVATWVFRKQQLRTLMLMRSYGLPSAGHFSSTPSCSDVRFHLPSVDLTLHPLRSVRFAIAIPHV
jgi:hypothetical protein